MNALDRQATGLSLALCRDAFGNLYSGQEQRAFGFLREAVGVLDALQKHADSKGSINTEKALREVMEQAITATDTLKPARRNRPRTLRDVAGTRSATASQQLEG
ncbi:hypothetical protein RA280_43710 [Cupriavidus sp. CV2]|uniref:hypothetical protein n=1 Tax=Cupriavidus ulmosensis TaxID=3065913 RepID=UPI00296B01B4|nr:hypothetical protein [Cupriavidus sp. CV2]MDW3688516.1 hypothetical protein [Cupriavidus sp. CV2]